jgi:hypothetical protein
VENIVKDKGGLIHGGAYIGRAYTQTENIVKDKGGLIHGGAYIGKGLYTEFYGMGTVTHLLYNVSISDNFI